MSRMVNFRMIPPPALRAMAKHTSSALNPILNALLTASLRVHRDTGTIGFPSLNRAPL